MKPTSHIKPKSFLWTELVKNLLLAKYLTSRRCSTKNDVLKIFWKFNRKTSILEGFFSQACNFIKETPTQALFCEICKIFKNTYFEKHLRKAASASRDVADQIIYRSDWLRSLWALASKHEFWKFRPVSEQ